MFGGLILLEGLPICRRSHAVSMVTDPGVLVFAELTPMVVAWGYCSQYSSSVRSRTSPCLFYLPPCGFADAEIKVPFGAVKVVLFSLRPLVGHDMASLVSAIAKNSPVPL